MGNDVCYVSLSRAQEPLAAFLESSDKAQPLILKPHDPNSECCMGIQRSDGQIVGRPHVVRDRKQRGRRRPTRSLLQCGMLTLVTYNVLFSQKHQAQRAAASRGFMRRQVLVSARADMVLHLFAAAAVFGARRLHGVRCQRNNCCRIRRCHACAVHVLRDARFTLHVMPSNMGSHLATCVFGVGSSDPSLLRIPTKYGQSCCSRCSTRNHRAAAA